MDDICTECGHLLSQHESDEDQPRRYSKWCHGVNQGGAECRCGGFRDEKWEPDQFFEDGGRNR